ncbi:hypothetical protein ACFQUU_06255 [Herbaspirillum sp. GCM10030257]|uniref:hypothetical protein n=1 Tax=Herbaspirillum sp. GCM10030257 TaxID=3273393 RepID=UPI003615433E
MGIVHEHIDTFPFEQPVRIIKRQEELLLAPPISSRMKKGRDHAPIEAVHFTPEFVDQPFGHPRGVYESEFIRVEWQTMMDNRQPFYHRNCGADEISYQVCGERFLVTDMGTARLERGDFSRLPNGTAHDNYGRREIHLLFYIPGPVVELQPAARTSDMQIPPFPGWEAQTINEMLTEGLGGPGKDIAMFPVDERMLLETANDDPSRLQIIRAADVIGTTWLYRAADVMLGRTYAAASDGRVYRRHVNAHEVQYQLSGQRSLVTQRGVLQIEPGDFVCIPAGVAFTSIHKEPSAHLTLVSTREMPQVPEASKKGAPVSMDELERLRS